MSELLEVDRAVLSLERIDVARACAFMDSWGVLQVAGNVPTGMLNEPGSILAADIVTAATSGFVAGFEATCWSGGLGETMAGACGEGVRSLGVSGDIYSSLPRFHRQVGCHLSFLHNTE